MIQELSTFHLYPYKDEWLKNVQLKPHYEEEEVVKWLIVSVILTHDQVPSRQSLFAWSLNLKVRILQLQGLLQNMSLVGSLANLIFLNTGFCKIFQSLDILQSSNLKQSSNRNWTQICHLIFRIWAKVLIESNCQLLIFRDNSSFSNIAI